MTTTSSGFDSTSEMLSRETSRKICSVFSQMSSLLLSEISTLKARLERLEAELQSVTENAEDARRWREDVLSGCLVLLQQSGLLFALKPFGRLTRRTAAQQRDEESSSAAQMDRLDEEVRESRGDGTLPPPPGQAVKDCDVPNRTQEVAIGSNRKLFVCDVCGKSFSRQLQLKKHTNTHSERRPFACEQCPRRFRDSVTFEKHRLRHQERIHASFCCPLCAKTFKSRTGLKKHQLVHTDVRPFVCAVCQKGFKTKYNLRAHEALHATKTFQDAVTLHEQPHTCTACGKAFTRRSSLRGHQAVHRGKIFTCEVCGTGFSLQHNLRRHTRLHTGQKLKIKLSKESCSFCPSIVSGIKKD
ncbi:zinc finger protein 260 [Oryzias melastigma]|uniref:zinc finger protein 260 n=1 Tax=Oryzias melastigma TaxID=30732 RepID=UPI000CF7BE35|nr:zinc finger protein 260 [Oryzias melastigma]XP_036071736.1 zinc finger protein 260 [Oryzias melastigma]XP_036071737.1 zinc finger protein 260 [Oryzias melastigma]XP_036071738.1 zinc finger protein 260 [Oryzias melastigma]XP_036071739.1 zinc finger protein 260 [Oryzias melastigma]XP_036071740.1 zinc finger protein 260 [Oryzias melastigma]XP_036071741.1 zinc finger protein 260 [Oryzias melastigma]XP_036071742.1 zinc finger protein 260 [Oryzias melastigma]XP_036071743.1 zinc finger protein 